MSRCCILDSFKSRLKYDTSYAPDEMKVVYHIRDSRLKFTSSLRFDNGWDLAGPNWTEFICFFFFFLLPAPLQLYLCICVFTFFFLSRFCLLSLMLCFNNWQSVMLFQDAQSKGLFPSCFPLPNGKLKRVGWIGRGGSTFLVFSCIWLHWVSHSELQTLTHALSTFSALGLSANRVQQTQKPLNPLL